MDLLKLIDQLIPIIGQKAADAIAEQIKDLISDQSPAWQKTVLALVSDAIKHYGVAGLQIAIDQIEKMIKGDPPEIEWANILVASDIVAMMQKAEAAEKTAVKDFLGKLGKLLGDILSGVIRGLLAG